MSKGKKTEIRVRAPTPLCQAYRDQCQAVGISLSAGVVALMRAAVAGDVEITAVQPTARRVRDGS